MMNELKYELIRMRTLRSTWIISALAILQALGFVTLFALVGRGQNYVATEPTRFESMIGFILVPFFVVLVSVIAAQAFGHDYRHGTIRVTLSTFPRRGRFLTARAGLVIAYAVVWSLVTIAAVAAAVELYRSTTGGMNMDTVYVGAAKFTAVVVMYCIIVMSLTVLFRSMPIGLVAPMISFSFLEYIVLALTYDWDWVGRVLPSTNAIGWASTTDSGWGIEGATPLPMLVLAMILGAAATTKFLKADA
ncbi:MAG: hypothetical protein RL441_1203 [Actinomycetota bacterium]